MLVLWVIQAVCPVQTLMNVQLRSPSPYRRDVLRLAYIDDSGQRQSASQKFECQSAVYAEHDRPTRLLGTSDALGGE